MPICPDSSVFARSAALLAIGLSFALAGCAGGSSGEHATDGSRPARSATTTPTELDAYLNLGYRLEWKAHPIIARGNRIQYVDLFSDSVVIHDTGNLVTVMETSTGANRWSSDLGADVTRFVGNIELANGSLLASTETDAHIIDIRTGQLLDRHRLGVLANTRPVLSGNYAIYGGTLGELFAHNLNSGYKQWGFKMNAPIEVRPVRVGEDVVSVSRTGEVVIVQPRTGSVNALTQVYDGVTVPPAASNTMVFIAGLDQSVWAIDRASGKTVWRLRTERPLRDQPVYHDSKVYVHVPSQGMKAIDAVRGTVLWTAPGVKGHILAMRAGRLIAWDGQDAVQIDPLTGDVIERITLPRLSHLVTDSFVDGNLYAATNGGVIQKFSPRR